MSMKGHPPDLLEHWDLSKILYHFPSGFREKFMDIARESLPCVFRTDSSPHIHGVLIGGGEIVRLLEVAWEAWSLESGSTDPGSKARVWANLPDPEFLESHPVLYP